MDADEENESDTDDEDETVDLESMGHVNYSSVQALMQQWNDKNPISGVLVGTKIEQQEFFCCVKGVGAKVAIQFQTVEGRNPVYKFGLHYHEFELVEEDELVDWEELTLSNYAVLLPLNTEAQDDDRHQYAMITSDWRTLGETGSLEEPYTVVLECEFDDWKDNAGAM